MKNFRTFTLFAFAAALLGLGGCASVNTPKKNLAWFEAGEQSIYAVVAASPKPMRETKGLSENCGKHEGISPLFNKWEELNICNQMDKWQKVATIYHTEKMKTVFAAAPHDLKIETGDIVEVAIELSAEGEPTRPMLVKRVARKEKDATKASGCWWDAGKWAASAFHNGGAVCDGWNWRDQKWAK
ncbi:hypothetical protein [Limnohabitans sp.]|jgi:hypothetical protein|uniref:hypothetical protein n=1 Tax=Limnohabitans sp. TaxID=1907725 RepID=UPI0037C0A3E8